MNGFKSENCDHLFYQSTDIVPLEPKVMIGGSDKIIDV